VPIARKKGNVLRSVKALSFCDRNSSVEKSRVLLSGDPSLNARKSEIPISGGLLLKDKQAWRDVVESRDKRGWSALGR
jgi:hypothetical protein